MDYFTQLENLEQQAGFYKAIIKYRPLIVGLIVFGGIILNHFVSNKKEKVVSQITVLKDLREEKINQLLFSVSFFEGTYSAKLIFAKSIINEDPILKGYDFNDNIIKLKNLEQPNIQKAISFYISGEMRKSLSVFKILLPLNNNTFDTAVINSYMGNIYLFDTEPNFDKAYFHLITAEKKINQLKREDELFLSNKGDLFSDLGFYFKRMGKFKKSKRNFEKALKIFEDLNMIYLNKYDFMLGKINQNIYTLYADRDDLMLAEPFLVEAIKYKSKSNIQNIEDANLLLSSIISYINLNTKKKEFDQALAFSEQALEIINNCDKKRISNIRTNQLKSNLYNNISNLYTQKFYKTNMTDIDLIETSKEYQSKAISTYLDIINSGSNFNPLDLSRFYYGRGIINTNLKDHNSAKSDYKKSIQLIEQYFPDLVKVNGRHSTSLSHSYLELSKLYCYIFKNKKKALNNAQKAIDLYTLNLKHNPNLQKWVNEANDIISKCI
ncbi:tetratricopeptide repeat protein [Gelatiniphilus marinus]|uniref:Tetratricopeptide repeat protein n=1 Tax=Gelatiniphilus marinus TaxID=1759464 RepID=A0ABW5JSJ7_9FLAO